MGKFNLFDGCCSDNATKKNNCYIKAAVVFIVGLILGSLLVGCEKPNDDVIPTSETKLTSVTVSNCTACKSADDTITVALNGVNVTGTFNGLETFETNAAGSQVDASRQYDLSSNEFGFQKITLNLQGNAAGPESGYISLTTGTEVVVIVANGNPVVDFSTTGFQVTLSFNGTGTVTVDDLGIAPTSGVLDPFNLKAVFNADVD